MGRILAERLADASESLIALADGWMTEDDGVAHVGACQDFHCPTCAVAACAEDVRRIATEATP